MQSNSASVGSQLILFFFKAGILVLLLIVTSVVIMPDFSFLSYSIKKAAKDEKVRVTLLSFVQNPAALYRASEIDQKAEKFESAIMEMELAIGLLEMHNANQTVINRYKTKLNQLNSLLMKSRKNLSLSDYPSQKYTGKPKGVQVKRWMDKGND